MYNIYVHSTVIFSMFSLQTFRSRPLVAIQKNGSYATLGASTKWTFELLYSSSFGEKTISWIQNRCVNHDANIRKMRYFKNVFLYCCTTRVSKWVLLTTSSKCDTKRHCEKMVIPQEGDWWELNVNIYPYSHSNRMWRNSLPCHSDLIIPWRVNNSWEHSQQFTTSCALHFPTNTWGGFFLGRRGIQMLKSSDILSAVYFV